MGSKRTKKASELWDKCETVIDEYADRDTFLDEVETYYFLDFETPDGADPKKEGVEVVHMPHGTAAVDLVCDLLAGADINVTVPALSEKQGDKKLADNAEAFLGYLLRESERQQRQRLMSRASWLAAVRGCICGRVVVLYERLKKVDNNWTIEADRLPMQLQLRDPRRVYPRFALDGLAYVAERWERTVQDVRDAYGDDLLAGRASDEDVEWTEYWDDESFCLWADGTVISKGKPKREGPWPHLLGGIPYVWEFCRETAKEEPEDRVRPLLASVMRVIDRLDIADSQAATAQAKYYGDALVVQTDRDPPPDIDLSSGAVNFIGMEEKVDWLRANKAPMDAPLLRQDLSTQFERATFPGTLYGREPGTVTAGYAINMLNQSGLIRLQPITEALQFWLAGMLERSLMVCEELLQALLKGPIPYWTMDTIEDQGKRRSLRKEGSLDAEKLEGRYLVNVTLGDILPADEQAHVVVAQKAREPGPDGKPLLSWETTVEKFKLASSPSDERERIDREVARADEEVTRLRIALYAEEEKAELRKKIGKLDGGAEILAKIDNPPQPPMQPGMGGPVPGQIPGPMAPAGGQMPGMPPQVMPPQMAGMTPELMGQAPGMGMPDLASLPPEQLAEIMRLYGGGM